MYSNYPFPNRKDRVLDTFQQEALAFVLKNPTKPFSKKSEINGVTVLRTAFADPLFTHEGVKCHNNRLDSPKDDWKLGSDIPMGWVRYFSGWVIGFFSTFMGIGGGVMNNTFMTIFGRPMHQAVATSSGTGVLISIPGVIGYIWAGWGVDGLPPFSIGFVNLLAFAMLIPITLFMAPLGVRAAHSLSKKQLEFGFGIFLLLVSVRFFLSL